MLAQQEDWDMSDSDTSVYCESFSVEEQLKVLYQRDVRAREACAEELLRRQAAVVQEFIEALNRR
ncbi:hypothetical protein FB45DRAFT_1025389 [Roridomyces roridus]|uniref:Uncharacterized protein n=1 Tax=Roridomyces roridus TaxID=1738132 RepID=A0AAD7C002_9AGAR|nr:hypothetical protein FB45DRAFT_1025389 [Roridomyces roridus]